ncbi:hypothetical protein E8E11_005311 [Didymella keratinophila]|nr:hypothetical protein E8E11_005311 [Didymella keratinophila]
MLAVSSPVDVQPPPDLAPILPPSTGHPSPPPSPKGKAGRCYKYNDVVTIRVTHDGKAHRGTKEYMVFRELIRRHFAYFAAALDPAGGFLEHTTRVLEIECHHEVFDAFMHWLHIGQLKDLCEDASTKHDLFSSMRTLCMLWVFWDCRGIPELGNAVIHSLHKRFTATWTLPDVSTTQYIYENTVAGCTLRKLILQFFVATKTKRKEKHEKIPEFCSDLGECEKRSAATWVTRKALMRWDRCQWHDHSGPGGKLRLVLRTRSLDNSHG